MKTVTILETFDGYPNGRDVRTFTAGSEVELSNEYADLLVGKGLVELGAAKTSPKASAADAAEKKDDEA